MRRSKSTHKLAKLRISMGITQGEMANLLGVSRPTIQAIELGKLTMSPKLEGRMIGITGGDLEALIEKKVSQYREKLRHEFGIISPNAQDDLHPPGGKH
jgi:DNA-binding XRE family transcriptional regulator